MPPICRGHNGLLIYDPDTEMLVCRYCHSPAVPNGRLAHAVYSPRPLPLWANPVAQASAAAAWRDLQQTQPRRLDVRPAQPTPTRRDPVIRSRRGAILTALLMCRVEGNAAPLLDTLGIAFRRAAGDFDHHLPIIGEQIRRILSKRR